MIIIICQKSNSKKIKITVWILIIVLGFRVYFKNRLLKCCLCCDRKIPDEPVVEPNEIVIRSIRATDISQTNDSQNPPFYENVINSSSNENEHPPCYQNMEIDFQIRVLNI